MTDSPTKACPHPGKPDWSTHPTTQDNPEEHPPHSFLRREQHAPNDVGVKDLRPLRGRPTGPILDPDALTRRAQNLTEKTKERSASPRGPLTGPTPTGMTHAPG
jgi:hypothetical protein